MQRNYKSASKESAFTSQKELSDSPLSAEASLFNTMETKEIPFAPGYFCSNIGDIYSERHTRKREKLKPQTAGLRGYERVCLYINGKVKRMSVHRLVALTFIPNPDNLPEVNHKNSIRNDNWEGNLEWCTMSYNMLHAFREGNKIAMQGELNGNSKLTPKEVRQIRSMYIPRKVSTRRLARKFNISQREIFDIVTNKIWRHI
jgi:hypothetical protein